MCFLQPFAGGGYRLGAAPEEESAYVAGERRRHSGQDVSVHLPSLEELIDCSATFQKGLVACCL